MNADAIAERKLALGLAHFVIENGAKPLKGEVLSAIIYRLRVVEAYAPSDVDLVCDAMRMLIAHLVFLPNITYAPEVWIPIFAAVTEGAVEPQWHAMMVSEDVAGLAENFPVPETTSALLPKCNEQITSICQEYALELGLTRRLFSAISGADLVETTEAMSTGKWDNLNVRTSWNAMRQLAVFFEKPIHDSFTKMKDHLQFARELYFVSLARVMKRYQDVKTSSVSEEDSSFYDFTFQLLDEVVKKTWPFTYIDEEVKKSTLQIFEELLRIAPVPLIQKTTEKMKDTCEWLRISPSQICDQIEGQLWTTANTLVQRLVELIKNIPYEIDYDIPDDFEAHCEQLPSSNKDVRFLRFNLDATRTTLHGLMEILVHALKSEEVVKFMKESFPVMHSSSEQMICETAIEMYKNSMILNPDDELLVAQSIMKTKAIVKMPELIQNSKNTEVSKKILRDLLIQMAEHLENGDSEDLVKALRKCELFWTQVARLADKEMITEMARKLIFTAGSGDADVIEASLELFLTLMKLKLETSTSEAIICNFDFVNLDVPVEKWNDVGELLNGSIIKKCPSPIALFTLRQLTTTDLELPELIYVVTHLNYLKTEEGAATIRKFYQNVNGFEADLKKFMSKESLTALCAKFLKELSTRVVAMNKLDLLNTFDHANMLSWLDEIGVLGDPLITTHLVELCRTVEAWDSQMLLHLDSFECTFDDMHTFSRFWKCDVMTKLNDEDQKTIEEKISKMLDAMYEKQSEHSKISRESRSIGTFPARPKPNVMEEKLLTIHNRIAAHLTKKKVEEFSDESSALFEWLIGVSSGQISYSKDNTIDAKKIMARLYPDGEKRTEIQFHYGVKNVLKSASNLERPNRLKMRSVFTNIYRMIVETDMKGWKADDPLEAIDRRMGGFRAWIRNDEGAINGDLYLKIVVDLSNLCWDEWKSVTNKTNDVDEEEVKVSVENKIDAIRKFTEVVASECHFLPEWMLPSTQPFLFSEKIRPVFDLIYSFPDVAALYSSNIDECLKKIFCQFFSDEHQMALVRHPLFNIQQTDKYLSSMLNMNNSMSGEKKPMMYDVGAILSILSKYGSLDVQLECLRKIRDELKTLPEKVIKNVGILNGSKAVETIEDRLVVCDVVMLTECLGYVNCLDTHLSPGTSSEDVMRAFMLLNSQSNATRNEKQENQKSSRHVNDEMDMHFCTFKSTGKTFTNQHWYNCYTCDMMDTIGVCSTCAVNCHRGHELAYSKYGAFFCDCGSTGCESMEHIEHFPNAMSSLRGQYPNVQVPNNKPKSRELFSYTFENLGPQTDELRSVLGKVRQEFDKKKNDISKILEAVSEASHKALDVKSKRTAVLTAMSNPEEVVVSSEETFMAPLDSGEFFPMRRIDVICRDRISTPSMRDIADIIKLDNGTELLAVIPECVQTCLQFHYFDTRGDLIQGMFSLRTETEPIPFHARRLHACANRLVVCGVHEIYALRFSPQGAVIDRAHIKLIQNGSSSSMSSNPVVKAQFCRAEGQKKQLVAVSTLQYVRVYDLTLHESNFVEEMVLTAGNVQDVVILTDESSGDIRVIVLSTTGYVYEHIITNFEADNNSIFLTNVVNVPDPSGDGVSLHYSHTFNLLFCSFEKATYMARLPALKSRAEREINDGASRYDWRTLRLKSSVHVWRESAGIIGCLSAQYPHQVIYIHPTASKVNVQLTTASRPVLSFYISASSKNQAVHSVLIYPDSPTGEIWETNWSNVHDLWIDDVPSERFAIETNSAESLPPPLPHDDLVLMAESCAPLSSVDWSSRDLEMIYTHEELNHRLSVDAPKPLTVIQQTRFKISAKVTNSRKMVRMIRLEVQGMNGPEAVMVGNVRYAVSTRTPKVFDLLLTREESIAADLRDVTIEMFPRPNQTTLRVVSLQLYGCDRSQMEEIQPLFEREPTLALPSRLSYSIIEFSMRQTDIKWTEEVSKRHLNRKTTHPLVCQVATRALAKCYQNGDRRLFEILDEVYLKEWKGLKEWTDDKGFSAMRTLYVEDLLDRLESVRTRWTSFQSSLTKEFGTPTAFLELMRDEMRKMPLHRCQMMAQAIVKVFFGLLASGRQEEDIRSCFLSIFTSDQTAHLANDMRSAVQETISRFEYAVKEEKRLLKVNEQDLHRLKDSTIRAFYGAPRIVDSSPESQLILNLSGTVSLHSPEDTKWLETFISSILSKLQTDNTLKGAIGMHISDSPTYNLSRVLAASLALCDPQVIGRNFSALLKLINFKDESIVFPLSETAFSNYALLRTVELLLAVCLEKRGEEKDMGQKPYTDMLDKIVHELQTVGIREFCYRLLEQLIPYWKEKGPITTSRSSQESKKVWLPHVPLVSSSANQPNTTVTNWPSNTNEAYVIACTDLVLLIPQHLQELERRKSQPRDDKWIQKLCQLASLSQGCSAYRQCKKLLLAICHNDEIKYKTMRDKYKMQDLLQQLVQKYLIVSKEVGGHQQLTELVDVLVSITKLALTRPDMWRDVCSTYTTWLLRLACYTTDVVASQVVELLIVAVRDSSVGGQLSIQLADSIIEAKNGEFIEKIIKRFLIGKEENLRWTIHGMLRSVIQLASRQNQCLLVKKLYYDVYPLAKNTGLHCSQLVDLIATYAPRVFSSSELVAMTNAEMARVLELGTKLDEEGYLGAYKLVTEMGLGWKSVNFDRYPCQVCFLTKGGHDTVKMSAIKADTRYSAHAMIFKLISNYEVSKVTIKLTEVKKTKTIKKASLYYCTKSADPVDLKLHPEMWKKCAVVNVGENDATIVLSLAVPIVTSSLIVEFEEMTDGRSSSQLHCPRCSGAVRSQSGVCESCGENALQCMKCRSINYVDKEPFLCQSCGFCKYARIELFAQCRALPGAQHITSDTERGQCMQEMAQLLTKRESTRTKLTAYQAIIESLYQRARPLSPYRLHVENTHVSEYFELNGILGTDQLNFQSVSLPTNALASIIRTIHYEFLQQTQQLMYLHEELNRYDHASEVSVVFHKPQNTKYYSTSETCFGCICNQILHSVALLHSSCEDENALAALLTSENLTEKLGTWGQTYEPLREEIEELLVRFMFGRSDVTAKIESMCRSGDASISVIVKSLNYAADPTWQQKLKALVRMAIEKNDENSCLQALTVLNKYLEATKGVPAEEKKSLKIRKKEVVMRWLSSSDEWADCCSATPSTSKSAPSQLSTSSYHWISTCLFSQWMTVRSSANQLLLNLFKQQGQEPIALLVLCENFAQLEKVPSSHCDQFMNTAHMMIDSSAQVKARLFVQQFHVYLIRKIHEECTALHKREISLLADNSFGERLRCFVELLTVLLSGTNVENVLLKAGADDLLIFLLHSTIFLKRLMTRRTRALDAARQALEKLLRRVSCRDGSKLMNVCVESLKLVKDTSTLGIIVGVMLEIMNPTEETEESFLVQIEKDVAQEDFLQGRMTHNPYSSTDPGIGPLMRDIKNKICRETEMIALLEDDNGMELLVNGNIISLSLPVREVYDRIWKRTSGGAPMLIVYRMRGLMGDAVETFIENFGAEGGVLEEDDEDEQLVRMVEILTRCGGLDKLMDLLNTHIDTSSGRFLLAYLRKIFEKIVKTSVGRKSLVERRMVEKMMSVIRKCCVDVTNESKVQIGMELYKVVELVVSDKQVQDSLCGILESDAVWWFGLFEKRAADDGSITGSHRKEHQILEQMTASFGNVILGSEASERVLVSVYPKILQWSLVDNDTSDHHSRSSHGITNSVSVKDQMIMKAEHLALISTNIVASSNGNRLKQKILESGVITSTCQYLMKDLPNLFQPTESAEWKAFLGRPSLKLILTILCGLAKGHQATQKEIAKTTLKLLHRLENVASDNSIGTLAENVVETLKEDEEVRQQITLVRDETKKKKKQMAMANRTKQLTKMGMKVGSGGEVKVAARNLHNEPMLDETDSMSCCICRESVLRGGRTAGVYAFASIDLDSGNTGTVSMMVMVHFDCHKNAIRGGNSGRSSDEWTRAKMHNAGTKCNVITPMAVEPVVAAEWIEATRKFEADLGRVSGIAVSVVNRNSVFVDMCQLVDRFIYKRSFSSQTDGGGRESNMQYLGILHLLAVSFPADAEQLESSTPIHRLVAFLLTEQTVASWNEQKLDILRASLNDATTSGAPATWQGLKPTCLTWAFVDQYFNKVVPIVGDDRLQWLRNNLTETINKTRKFVEEFDADVLPCDEQNEFCDVTGAPLDAVNMFLPQPPIQN